MFCNDIKYSLCAFVSRMRLSSSSGVMRSNTTKAKQQSILKYCKCSQQTVPPLLMKKNIIKQLFIRTKQNKNGRDDDDDDDDKYTDTAISACA